MKVSNNMDLPVSLCSFDLKITETSIIFFPCEWTRWKCDTSWYSSEAQKKKSESSALEI